MTLLSTRVAGVHTMVGGWSQLHINIFGFTQKGRERWCRRQRKCGYCIISPLCVCVCVCGRERVFVPFYNAAHFAMYTMHNRFLHVKNGIKRELSFVIRRLLCGEEIFTNWNSIGRNIVDGAQKREVIFKLIYFLKNYQTLT
jgi:hypothetical protein